VWRRLDSLTKPRGSLGRLEALAADLCAMQRTLKPDLERAELLLFAADHGLANAGVSAYPRAVTAQMITNFLTGGAAASVLARQFGCVLRVIDVGVDAELPSSPALERASVARGAGRDERGAVCRGIRGGSGRRPRDRRAGNAAGAAR
jgi:nicotinate-nucleotide--dimethylbenzimidazole phosphoribosyltransferase